jgi:MFS family permease
MMKPKATPKTEAASLGPNRETSALSTRYGRMLRFLGEQLGGRPLFSLNFGQTFAALRHRNYRLWFIGQLVSLVGTWMQTTAQGYLVFQLTHSPAYLGYVGFAAGAPSWLFMLYGGVVADRMPRRRLLLLTQTGMMILAFIQAVLTFSEMIRPWHIVLLALGLGVANAFDAPARQAFVVEMVDREDLTNAIALNSSMFNLATVVGPSVAGLTYAFLGPAWCFTINGVSFIAVIAALLLMRLTPNLAPRRATAALEDLKEGLRYVASHLIIRTIVSVAAVISLFGLAFMTLIPAWATTIMGGDATTNGWLLGARGVGALIGALMIAALGNFNGRGRLLTIGSFVFPVMVLFFAQMRWLPLSLLTLVGAGWGFMVLFNLANNLIQTLVPDELRGRVVSIYTLGFFGLMPLGALLAGWAAEWIGEPNTVALSALISLGFAGWLWLRVPQLRALE